MTTVFDSLAQVSQEDLGGVFLEKIQEVFEYDSDEVQRFLLSITPDDTSLSVRDILFSIRSVLHESVKQTFPSQANSELFNRRKMELIAEDIYILGCCITNGILDKRLDKSVKSLNGMQPSGSNLAEVNRTTATGSSNAGDLMEICLSLNTTIKDLTEIIDNLKLEVADLKREVQRNRPVSLSLQTGTEIQGDKMNDGASTSAADASTRAVDEDSIQSSDNIPNGNNSASTNDSVTDDTPVERSEKDDSPVNRAIHTNAVLHGQTQGNDNAAASQSSGDFQLPRSQRTDIRRGHFTTGTNPKRTEICGVSDAQMHISSAPSKLTRSVYVGGLSNDTTLEKMRHHLRDRGISHITDVIKLNCRNPEHSSFCIVVDNELTEAAMYSPSNWPKNVRVRPYEPKKSPRKPQGNRVSNHQRQRQTPPRQQQQRQKNTSPQYARTSDTVALPQPPSAPSNASPVTLLPPQSGNHHAALISNHPPPTQAPTMMHRPYDIPSAFPMNLIHSHGGNGVGPIAMTNRYSEFSDPRYWIPAF